jgi:hypothetical protein
MANEEHLQILRKGVEAWNIWRAANDRIRPDLTGANLNRAHLSGANLSGAHLSGAYLRSADLRGANLRSADLSGSYLIFADLRGADLGGANLSSAHLGGADLTESRFGRTAISDVDLSEAKGLEAVTHVYPSSIGIDTIYKSRGKIPEAFLRGAGVPDNLIAFLPSLLGPGIEFYSCFISYSHQDEEFCKRLHSRMQAEHLRVWFAPEDMPGGKKLHEEIETQIRVFDKLLLVLSEASLKSAWVMTELRKARKAERDTGKRKLFPIRLATMEAIRAWECFDAEEGTDLAVEVGQYFIPDFSDWKSHDPFEAAFARLLKDLKGKTPALA